ncbi:MAG: acetoacetate decarboxylase family protein [Myxococcota bacterium]
MSASETPEYEIQGRKVTFPVEVRDASGAIAGFLVSSRAANRLVGDAFEIVSFLPGRTLFMLGCIDYKDNDLGDYNEVAMNFFVRRKGASRGVPYLGAWLGLGKGGLPSYSWKMPVNPSFTRDAGAIIWGFPKTIERIDFDYSREGRFHALLEMDGKKVFEIDLPRGGDKERPAGPSIAYSYIEGVPHVTRFTQQTSELGAGGGKGVELRLGSHPIADDLRSLGLPKKPLMTTWAGKMVMSFGPPAKL